MGFAVHGRIYIVLAVLYCIVIVRIIIIVQCIKNTVVVFMASNTAVFTIVILLTTLGRGPERTPWPREI